ncbi:MAG: acyltransferase family protein [Actinomycetota bacterium]|nr:acyltransferase family protein [Actinomycetota bacterium]
MPGTIASGVTSPASATLHALPPQQSYRPALDGLRAIAVALVVAFHLDHLAGGILGVDAFFVVSGWLITFKLLSDVDHHRAVRLRHFWAGRLRRLMPASLAVLAAVSIVWPLADIAVASLRRDVLWSLAWATNWGTITGGGDYWARFGDPSPLNHYWSLAIEQQFYVVWPLVFLVAIRSRHALRRVVGVIAAVGSAASIAFMIVWFDPSSPTDTYMNTAARAHSLLIGAVAAAFTLPLADGTLRGARAARRLTPIAAAGAVAIIALAENDSVWLFRWGFPVFAIAMVVVVVAAADGLGASILGSAPMRWIGDHSYGLYLWHWPAFLLLTPERTQLDGLVLDTVRVAAAIVLADLSLRLLEEPIRSRRRLAGRKGAVALVASMAVVAMLAVFVVPDGAGGPGSSVVTLPPVETVAPTAPVTAPVTSPTVPTDSSSPSTGVETTLPSTTLPIPTGPARVLVAGDSTAVHLSDQLIAYAADHPDEVVAGSAAFPGCGLSAGDDGRLHLFTNEQGEADELSLAGCVGAWQSIVDRVASGEQIDIVLVDIGAWDAVDIRLPDGEVVSVADPIGRALIDDAYRSFVDEVETAGASVVWVTPPDVDLQWDEVDSPIDDPARWTALREIIDSLPVEQVDLARWLTDSGLDGPAGRPDGVHLAEDVGIRFVSEALVPRLLEIRAVPQ